MCNVRRSGTDLMVLVYHLISNLPVKEENVTWPPLKQTGRKLPKLLPAHARRKLSPRDLKLAFHLFSSSMENTL